MTAPVCHRHFGQWEDVSGRAIYPNERALRNNFARGYQQEHWSLCAPGGPHRHITCMEDIPGICEPADCEYCKEESLRTANLTPYKFPDPDGETKTTDAQGNPIIRRNWERPEIPFEDD